MNQSTNAHLEMRLAEHWCSLWERLLGRLNEELQHWTLGQFDKLAREYGKRHRAYHNLTHIAYLLGLLWRHRHLADNPDTVEVAIWFHDVIYDTRRDRPKNLPSNETLSIAYARRVMHEAGLPEEFQKQVEGLIDVTHHKPNMAKTPDERLMADMDWSPLGWRWLAFVENGKLIRREYHEYSDEEFRFGRLGFVRSALERGPQFYLLEFRKKYEAQARRNLERELVRLGG